MKTEETVKNTESQSAKPKPPENPARQTSKWVIFVNSLVIFMLSFVLLYMLSLFLKEYMNSRYGMQFFYDGYRLGYKTPDASPLWTKSAILGIYAIPSLFYLFLGVVAKLLFNFERHNAGLLKLFFLWSYVSAFVLFFGGLLAGNATNQGFYYALNWLYINPAMQLVLALISAGALFFLGKIAGRDFMSTAYTKAWIEGKKEQMRYKLFLIYLPVLVGVAIFIAVGFPSRWLYDYLTFTTFLLLLFPTFGYYDLIQIVRQKRKMRVSWGFVIGFLFYFVIFSLMVRI